MKTEKTWTENPTQINLIINGIGNKHCIHERTSSWIEHEERMKAFLMELKERVKLIDTKD